MEETAAAPLQSIVRYRPRRWYLAFFAVVTAVSGWTLADTVVSGGRAGSMAVLVPLWMALMIAWELLNSAYSAVELSPEGIAITDWCRRRCLVPWGSYRGATVQWPLMETLGIALVQVPREGGRPARTWLGCPEARRLLTEIDLWRPRPEAPVQAARP